MGPACQLASGCCRNAYCPCHTISYTESLPPRSLGNKPVRLSSRSGVQTMVASRPRVDGSVPTAPSPPRRSQSCREAPGYPQALSRCDCDPVVAALGMAGQGVLHHCYCRFRPAAFEIVRRRSCRLVKAPGSSSLLSLTGSRGESDRGSPASLPGLLQHIPPLSCPPEAIAPSIGRAAGSQERAHRRKSPQSTLHLP